MMPSDEEDNEKPYSAFRDFLIPDVQNTLQGAAHRHELGDYDGAKALLDIARAKIDGCERQIEEDRQT